MKASKNIDNDLYLSIIQIRNQMKSVKNKFQNEVNPILINSYIYELKALEEKHAYYLSLCTKQCTMKNIPI